MSSEQPWGREYPDDRSAIADMTALLVGIATEYVDEDRAREYSRLRTALLRNPNYAPLLPATLRTADSAGKFQAAVNKEASSNQEATAAVIRMLEALVRHAALADEQRSGDLSSAGVRHSQPTVTPNSLRVDSAVSGTTSDNVDLRADSASSQAGYGNAYGLSYGTKAPVDAASSDGWTGIPSRTQRLLAVRGQIEAAHEAVGYLIEEISADGNGGPRLDEHEDALEALRELHRILGSLLDAIETGRLNDEMGEGFAADLARFGDDWLVSLRDNRARYLIATMTFAALSACGLADWGGMIGGAVLSVPKRHKMPGRAEPKRT